MNEALLTGEPYPVAKRPGVSRGATPAEAANAVFSGTAMVAGAATMLVVATGPATKLGGVAAALAARRPATAFERGLRGLGLLILRLTVFLVLFVLLAHLAFHRPPLESFLFAVALAVGLTPELLPMVTTVTLSRGAMRMAAQAGGGEAAGGDPRPRRHGRALHRQDRDADRGADRAGGCDLAARVLQMAAINAGLASGIPTTLDAAILAAQPVPAGWRMLAEVPFGFERRRSSLLVAGEGQRLLVVKGAPEAVLEACTSADGLPFDRAALLATAEARGAEGLRLLGVATRAVPEGEAVTGPDAERDLTFLGFCAFLDPPKHSAAAAVARLAALGIRTKIVSGDAAPVVRHLVAALGIPAEGVADRRGDRRHGPPRAGGAGRACGPLRPRLARPEAPHPAGAEGARPYRRLHRRRHQRRAGDPCGGCRHLGRRRPPRWRAPRPT